MIARADSKVTEGERLVMSKKIKVHSLTGRITPELMRKAFKAVKPVFYSLVSDVPSSQGVTETQFGRGTMRGLPQGG